MPLRADTVVRSLTATVGTLGLVSLAGGSALAISGSGRAAAAFGQQTAGWGAVNMAIAGLGAWRSRRSPPDPQRLQRILLVNTLLDVGYVAFGAWLARTGGTHGGRLGQDAALGHGTAIAVQGLALGAIDSGALLLLSRTSKSHA